MPALALPSRRAPLADCRRSFGPEPPVDTAKVLLHQVITLSTLSQAAEDRLALAPAASRAAVPRTKGIATPAAATSAPAACSCLAADAAGAPGAPRAPSRGQLMPAPGSAVGAGDVLSLHLYTSSFGSVAANAGAGN